mgnify:CR=1 FL=1
MREMKDSGVEWIGEIPEDWNVGKTLYALSMPITDGPHETPELFDEGIPFISAEAVSCGNGHIDFEHIRGFISQEFYEECCKKYIPQINDIYMIKSGATTGKVAKVETQKLFTIWSPLAVFRVEPQRCYYEYLYYFIQSDAYQKQIENKWTYGTQQNIGMRTLEKLMICFPSITQQKLIADYLDVKCSKIDVIIEKQQAIIEKLKEYKLSIINEAVTQGINPDVNMKQSGYKWIGSIPEHWNMVYAKQLFSQRKDRAFEDDEQLTASQKYGIISQKEFMDIEGRQVMQVLKGEEILKHVEKGDFVISMRSFQGGLEYSEVSGKISSAYVMLIPNRDKVCDRYYKWLFKSKKYISALQGTSNLIRDGQALRFSNFVQVYLPSLDLDEQKKIADYLDDVCPKIDNEIEKREKLLEKVLEYKKSLIYEVVTGKKEV